MRLLQKTGGTLSGDLGFNKELKIVSIVVSLTCFSLGSTAGQAGLDDVDMAANDDVISGPERGKHDFSVVINDDLTRRPADSTSGSGHTVEGNCLEDPSGNNWQDATATFKVAQEGGHSVARIKVKGAVPNEVFTVWLRLKGNILDDNDNVLESFGGSPLTGGGATPLAPGSALDEMIHYSPWIDPDGTAYPTNGFTTDEDGNANWSIALDFPLVGGAYPFNHASDEAVATIPGGVLGVPTVIVDPRQPRVGAPFLIRVISHCTDGVGHGLSPATREAWFQYP